MQSSSTESPIASTSSAPFSGFDKPRWIFSSQLLDEHESFTQEGTADACTAKPTIAKPSSFGKRALRLGLEEGEDASYGPSLKRRGNVKFVAAKGLDRATELPVQEDTKELKPVPQSKGALVKGMYETIVGGGPPPLPPDTQPSAKALRRRRDEPSSSLSLIDLTGEDDSDLDDDDVIVLDPITKQPLATVKRSKARAAGIHDLLGDTSAPRPELPTHYHFRPSHKGYQLLSKLGWKEGQGIGLEGGIKSPLKASNKFDRKGLGSTSSSTAEGAKSRKEAASIKRQEEDAKRRKLGIGKGAGGIARAAKRAERERKAMLAYMNR